MAGCTNPAAVNYDPSQTEDDGSCVYLNKIDGVCYEFTDVDISEIVDKSFTLSRSIEGDNWTFFHDYLPDFYFESRERLFSLKNGAIWRHNVGPYGKFYDATIKPFFIDVVFNSADEMTLNSVSWITEVINQAGTIEELSTLTEITIWNSYQCSGKIPLNQFDPLPPTGRRRLESEFSFNEFKDILIDRIGNFLKDVFNNRDVDTTKLNDDQPWYDKRLFEDRFFVIRFEFNNFANKSLSLHDVSIDANESIR